jgi:hypothetical protein
MLREGSVGTTKKAMAKQFSAMGRCRIAIEIGSHSPWLSRLLKGLGHEGIVANARQVKLISQSSRKDDRLDAQTLARLARVDPQLLRPIQHRSERAQGQEALMAIADLVMEVYAMESALLCTGLAMLGRFAKYEPVDAVALRRKIAEGVLARASWQFTKKSTAC